MPKFVEICRQSAFVCQYRIEGDGIVATYVHRDQELGVEIRIVAAPLVDSHQYVE